MNNYRRLAVDFYERDNVVSIAEEMLGKVLVSFKGGQLTTGIIIETEAYEGIIDRASHAFGDRRTKRTETMYADGGKAYIYLCYGIHSLLNVVTNKAGVPHAVLIRGIYPLAGQDIMSQRIGRKVSQKEGSGPGKVTKLLGLTYASDGEDLINGSDLWLEDAGVTLPKDQISITPRIGIGYAQEHALLPYRFLVNYSLIQEIVKREAIS